MKTYSLENTYMVESQTGLLVGSDFVESPNANERPLGVEPELIVVHGISLPPNQFGGEAIQQLFTNQLNPNEDVYFKEICALKVSAHLLIRRGGEIIQFVPFHKRAWHAGVSCFKGREGCNDFSIGIELEGTDETCYTASQYQSLAGVIKALWQAYPSLAAHNVVGHCDIAPGRKTDPGAYFLWEALERLLD
ncbi:MAG: 1,6-anhydro-N-acetylmuramyl-L-alanine amidase AmpD [Thiomicrorhabdus sp.]|nr:1,6-anhydro-N-acetylmuramyl-L-alanine amidase AmpD [Thiomicrorhabdus sp.]